MWQNSLRTGLGLSMIRSLYVMFCRCWSRFSGQRRIVRPKVIKKSAFGGVFPDAVQALGFHVNLGGNLYVFCSEAKSHGSDSSSLRTIIFSRNAQR